MTHYITPEKLTFEQIEKILTKKYKLALSDESKKLINDCKAYLDHKIATSDIYLILGSCSGLPVNDYVWGCWRIPKCFLGFKSCS